MSDFTDSLFLSRLQFALTSLFHITWPLLTVGLSIMLVAVEVAWIRTNDEIWYRQARFWARLFLLNFGVGVASGVPLSFQLGTNWGPYAYVSGDFIGNIMGYEASMAFALEAGFLGIMAFGWTRVPRGMHLFATGMVAFGASLSAFWIMVANSWMQTPTGVSWRDGRLYVDSYRDAIFNPNMPWGVSHMWMACILTTLCVVGGICAWQVLKGRHVGFFSRGLRIAIIGAAIAAPLQVLLGHESGLSVAEHQPSKLAASEAHWETNEPGTPASWALIAIPDEKNERNRFAIEIPYALSLVATGSPTGQVKGLKEFPPDERPPVAIVFWSLRIMIAAGFFLAALSLFSAWKLRRGALEPDVIHRQRWLLRAWVLALPAAYMAVWSGWIMRETGRQPWTIYGLLRTADSVSPLPASHVATSIVGFVLLYTVLFAAFLLFAIRIVRAGPDLDSPLPGVKHGGPHAEQGGVPADSRIEGHGAPVDTQPGTWAANPMSTSGPARTAAGSNPIAAEGFGPAATRGAGDREPPMAGGTGQPAGAR